MAKKEMNTKVYHLVLVALGLLVVLAMPGGPLMLSDYHQLQHLIAGGLVALLGALLYLKSK
ncbi:MAG: hypothetical protein J4428_04075 [Candidatus Aenigmarchaeota archaeon]|nr:hypothetical protein [Candidatus Aenigmarchaeota archaeon]